MSETIKLERKIAALLANDVAATSEIAAVISETASATLTADKAAKERLQAAIGLLQEKLETAAEAEKLARWTAKFEVLRQERDELASELQATYPDVMPRLRDLLKHQLTTT